MSETRQIDTPIRSTADYLDRIGKIVPPELTAALLIVQPLILNDEDIGRHFYILVAFSAFLTVLVPIYLAKFRGVTNRVQLAFSALSFPVWAAAMNTEQIVIQSDIPSVVVTVLMVAWALLIPIFVPARPTTP